MCAPIQFLKMKQLSHLLIMAFPYLECRSPQWATDNFCDDENNNAECNWDGGACCNNPFNQWKNYCTGKG